MSHRAAFESLIAAGRFAEALSAAPPKHSRNLDQRLSVAELTQLTGQNIEAESLTRTILKESGLSPSASGRCFEVLAAVALDAGRTEEALELLSRALTFSQQAGRLDQICRTQLRIVPTVADLGGGSRLTTLSKEVRRNVLRSGDRHLTALLHLRFGQIEAKRGLLDRARRHLKLGWTLLEDEPNVWIDGLLNLDASAVSALDGEQSEAMDFAQRALSLAIESGHQRTKVAALANLGLLSLDAGRALEAQRHLDEAIELASGFERIRIALLDSYAQLWLLNGDTARCESLIAQITAWNASKSDARASWLSVAATHSRVRLLMKQGKWAEALIVAETAAGQAQERQDPILECAFRLQEAEALATLKEPERAVLALNRTMELAAESSPETIAEVQRVRVKVLLAFGETREATRCFAALTRLLKGRGTAWTRALAAEDERQLAVARSGSDSERLDAPSVEAIARMFSFAGRPALLAQEAVHLISAIGCPANVFADETVSKAKRDNDLISRNREQAEAGSSRIVRTGSTGGRTYRIQLEPIPSGLRETIALLFLRLVKAAVELESLRRREKERTSLWPAEVDLETGLGVTASSVMQELLSTVERIALAGITVLITGETGVGKELVAREVHRRSERSAGPFLPFNCAAVPREMLESQLFGYKRGAFTGASDNFPGVIRSASGGTLFLDEIGELSPDVQPKLLRFLESNEVHPLGEARPVTVNVRTVAATNVDLERLVREGRFREDLYYRLNVVTVHVPPLRERREEVPLLAEYFLDRYSQETRRARLRITDEALEYLVLFRWPGNIRQLANEMRRIVALAPPGTDLVPTMLSPEILASRKTVDASQPIVGPNEAIVRIDQPLPAAIAQLESVMVRRALSGSAGHLEQAAAQLGISRKGLFLKRRRLALES